MQIPVFYAASYGQMKIVSPIASPKDSLENHLPSPNAPTPHIHNPLTSPHPTHQSLSEPTSFYLLALLGAGSLPGRLLAPLLGDRLGPLNLYPLFMLLAGLLALAWPHTGTTHAALAALSLLYGFAYGGIVSLPAPVVAAMTTRPAADALGTRIGLCFSFAGVSVLVGPPVAGAILGGGGKKGGDFGGLFAFAGGVMVVGSLCLAGVAWVSRRGRGGP